MNGYARIEPLGPHHDRAAFTCGNPVLDAFLVKQAGQEMRRMVSVTYLLSGATRAEVAGYYTLAATSIQLSDLPPAIVRRLPRYPTVPGTLLARLAVDSSCRGRGLGELLLLDALKRSLEGSRAIGSTAVITDAKDDAARRFYEHYGFRAFEGLPRRLFLPMATISGLFG